MMPIFMSKMLTAPRRAKKRWKPIAPTKGGITIGVRRRPDKIDFPGKSNFTFTTAKGRQRSVVPIIVAMPILRLFQMASVCRSFAKSSVK